MLGDQQANAASHVAARFLHDDPKAFEPPPPISLVSTLDSRLSTLDSQHCPDIIRCVYAAIHRLTLLQTRKPAIVELPLVAVDRLLPDRPEGKETRSFPGSQRTGWGTSCRLDSKYRAGRVPVMPCHAMQCTDSQLPTQPVITSSDLRGGWGRGRLSVKGIYLSCYRDMGRGRLLHRLHYYCHR